MVLTIVLAVVMMVGLFLLLLGGVGFVQDKKFFSSAPKEVLEVVPEMKPQRFKGQHLVGWLIIIAAFILMIGAIIIGAIDAVSNGFNLGQSFMRFFIMLLLVKVFDVSFFDWVLLCNAGLNFFPHFYPETKAVLGRHLFGFNWKTHLLQVICFIPVSAILAGICLLFN